MKQAKPAFSLIELTLVLALITLMFTLGTSNLNFLHRVSVRSELNNLHMVCKQLQRRAMALGKKQELLFDREKNTYEYDGSVHALPHYVQFGVLPGAKGPPSSPTRPITNPITFKKDRIVFHPDGIISSGTIYLVDADETYLYALSCGIAQVSYIRLYRYNHKWVLL